MTSPVTLTVASGVGRMWKIPVVPLTRLLVGHHVKLPCTAVGNMNIVTILTMTGMAHMLARFEQVHSPASAFARARPRMV